MQDNCYNDFEFLKKFLAPFMDDEMKEKDFDVDEWGDPIGGKDENPGNKR